MSESMQSCPECEQLRLQVRQAREERDLALLSLAKERERANAILLSQVAIPEPPPVPKPVRYWAVDLLNSGLKRALPLPHAGARAAMELVRKLRKGQP
jgi:hypothetical protein